MSAHTVIVFNATAQRELLHTRAARLPVRIEHAAFNLPWQHIAGRRAGIIETDSAAVPPELRDTLGDADVVFGFALPLRLVDLAPRLRWVETPAVGYDQLNGTGVLEKGIAVTTVGGLFAPAVTEHVFGLLLALTRRTVEFHAAQRRAEWKPDPVAELQDATMGIVGLGNIGQSVARVAKAFSMRVVGTRRRSDDVPPCVDRVYPPDRLHRMLAEADVVVVSVVGTRETAKLIDAAAFAAMKPGAYFINVARGLVVDEAALAAALEGGRLGGAGLDVFFEEPLPAAHPLWRLPNVIITPHVGANFPTKNRRSIEHFADNLTRFCNGESLVDLVVDR